MVNIFLSNKIIAFAAMLFGGLLIVASVLVFFGFTAFEPIAAAKSSQWTQETGQGISVPACGSSTGSVTCSGGAPLITFTTWTVEGPDPDGIVCASASITAGPSGGPQSTIFTGLPCSGGPIDWSGATLFNTDYTYSINFENGGHIITNGTFRTSGYCNPPLSVVPPPKVSCSVAPTSATTADTVTWTAVPSRGEAGAASGAINQSFESGWYPVWITSGQDQTTSARRFQATSAYWLKKVSLALSREAALTGRVRVTIENDAGGLPSGSTIVGGTSDLVDVSIISVWTGLNWIDFNFLGAELTAGTNYWIVLRGYFESGPANSIIHHAGAPADSNPGSKSLVRMYTSPGVWTDLTALGQDLWYKTYAATSPPSYSYSWAGSTAPLDTYTVNPVGLSYSGTGDKFGNVTVTSGGRTSAPAACSNFVNVTAANVPPSADVGIPHPTTVGVSHPHSGALATDPDGNLASYTWSFNPPCPGGCPSPIGPIAISGGSASIAGPTYTPSAAGVYNINLNVQDVDGASVNLILSETAAAVPTVDLNASPLSIPWNTATTLSWTSTDATSCTASGAWSGSKSASGSESTGNITAFPSTYTMTCTGPGGASAPDSVTINQSTPTLTINSFNAVPSSGDIPLNVGFDAQTTFTGNPAETIKYTLWWDCSYAGNSVADTINPALGNCGNPASPSIGAELLLSAPAIHSWPPPTVTHIYSNGGLKTVKLIAERGSGANQAIPVWISRVVNVTIPPLAGLSCNVNPKTVRTGDNVTWSAIWSGGQPDYTVIWSGDAPLPRTLTTSITSSSVAVQYAEPGAYDGSVEVQSLDDGNIIQTQGPVTCLSTVKVAPRFKIR